jgi:hypothetical protein
MGCDFIGVDHTLGRIQVQHLSYTPPTLSVEKGRPKSGPFCVWRIHSLSDDARGFLRYTDVQNWLRAAQIVVKDDESMSENTSLVEREQTDYLQYPGDGLVDILIGLWAVGFGVWMLVENVVFIALLPIFFLPSWRSLKKSITAPRMRHIDFTPAPNARRNLMAIMLVGVLTLALLMVLGLVVFWGQSTGNAPPWLLAALAWLREHATLAIGLFGAFMLGISALIFGLNRFYAYALLTVIVSAVAYLLGAHLWITVVVVGAMMSLSGMILLIRFLHTYPVETVK